MAAPWKYIRTSDDIHPAWETAEDTDIWGAAPMAICMPMSDEFSPLVSNTNPLVTIHAPYAFNITSVMAGVTTPTSGTALLTVVLKWNLDLTLTTTAITIDAGERTSLTAATPPVLYSNPFAVAAGDILNAYLTQLDGDNVATGLKVYLIGNKI